jgi:hypothetical protein
LFPEIGQYLHDYGLSRVQTAFNEYKEIAPYWFIQNFETTYNEGNFQHYCDYNSMFACKALVFKDSREELAKYLDAQHCKVGDLFYINNMVLTLDATSTVVLTPSKLLLNATPAALVLSAARGSLWNGPGCWAANQASYRVKSR